MPVIQILNNVSGYRFFTRCQRLQITLAHFGRDLVANVKQLSEVGIELFILLIVPERRDELRGSPTPNRLFRRQLRAINVNHRRVRRAQRVDVVERMVINLFGELQACAVALSQAGLADQL